MKYGYHYVKELVLNYINQIYYKSHRNMYDIKRFKNMYQGDSCFIIGNGPSLLPSDLNIIKEKDYVSFASNKIYKIFDKTDWRPTYITVSDSQFIRNKEVLAKIDEIDPSAFFSKGQYSIDLSHCNSNVCIINSDDSRKLLDSPQFSMRCDEIIYDIATVTYFSMQIAAYMGFSNIYLIGMDNKYKFSQLRDGSIVRNEGVCNYFGEKCYDQPLPKSASATWELDVAYEYADAYSRTHGFRIYNATRGGFLEKFERVDFDEVFGEKQHI